MRLNAMEYTPMPEIWQDRHLSQKPQCNPLRLWFLYGTFEDLSSASNPNYFPTTPNNSAYKNISIEIIKYVSYMLYKHMLHYPHVLNQSKEYEKQLHSYIHKHDVYLSTAKISKILLQYITQ